MRNRSFAIMILVLAVTVVACRTNVAESSGLSPDPAGLLVVGQADTSIFTVKPDGSGRTDLVEERPGLAAVQPTWSPDGLRLVWTEVDQMSEVPEPFIVTSGPGGEEIDRWAVPVAPFYYYWSPTGDKVAFLAGGPGGTVDLGILEDGAHFIGEAQPYYFAWAPDGQTLLTHTDLEAVALVTTDGTATTLERTEAQFQAPQWAADGSRLVYATGTPPAPGGVLAGAFQSNGQEIVMADTGGVILRGFGTFAGVATFELSPDGQQIAHSVTLDRKTFNFGPLVVTDIETGNETTVSQEPVLAFQWSPAGDALLYLATGEGIEHPTFRWAVWDGASSTEYAAVTPTPTFANSYLPFWDQYSRSHSLWAPDGSAFAYTSMNEGNDPIVWVQKVGGDAAAEEVASGDVVFWSPAAG